MTRELDEKVARVLGTTNSIDTNPCDVPYQMGRMESPHYSTDWCCVPELLAWFAARGLAVCHWGRSDTTLDEWTVETVDDGTTVKTGFFDRYKWPEALAKLVVAVEEAKS